MSNMWRHVIELAVIPLIILLSPVRSAGAPPATINVEIDFMADASHSHRPQQAEINAVIQMFACHGITLNVDIDDSITHIDVMRCNNLADDFFTCTDPNSFRTIKNKHFDHAGGGWHYCVFGHNYDVGHGTGSSGIAELNGDDFAVTLGSFAGGIGTAWDRAATFAHELGHNLGLQHGGDQSGVGNFKPNYASIMSYRYQLDGVRQQLLCLGLADEASLFKNLDYSDGRLPSINEGALDERRGVGIHKVDWDCDGTLDNQTVAQNLDSQWAWCFTSGSLTTLRDYNDWANIVDSTAVATEDLRPREIITCITADEAPAAKHLPHPGNCPAAQPALVSEPCVTGLMIWVDPGYSGTQTGTGDQPYRTLLTAYNTAPLRSVLFLQPGTHGNSGVPLVLNKTITLAGPGGAIVDP